MMYIKAIQIFKKQQPSWRCKLIRKLLRDANVSCR